MLRLGFTVYIARPPPICNSKALVGPFVRQHWAGLPQLKSPDESANFRQGRSDRVL